MVFELKSSLPESTQLEIDRIQAKPTASRYASETNFLIALDPYLHNAVNQYDDTGLITEAEGITVPTSYTGFKKGAVFIKKDQSGNGFYINIGDETFASFELDTTTAGGSSGSIPTGTAGGDLYGSYPSPSVNFNNDTVHLLKTGDTMAGILNMNGNSIANLTTPVGNQDAASKSYVDSVAQGLTVKASCVVATSSNITLSGLQIIDGVAVGSGDRVLVKNQSSAPQNGIYLASSGSWSRASDADTNAEVVSGLFTLITTGTVNALTGWVLTTSNPITLNVTPLTFTQFSQVVSFLGGNGLTLTGNVFDVVGTANRVDVSADAVDIAATYVGQSSITTVGTISTGTWNGTTIAIASGGTGATTASGARTALGLQAKTFVTVGTADADYITTDYASDDVAIQTALNNNNYVWVKSGTYLMQTSLKVNTNNYLKGDGHTTIFKLATNARVDVIKNADTSGGNTNIILKDFKIDGNKANQTAGISLNGILFGAVSDFLIEGVWAKDVGTVDATNIAEGFAIASATTQGSIIGCIAETNNHYGFNCYNASNITFSGNVSVGNLRHGFGCANGSSYITWIGNVVKNNLNMGFWVRNTSNSSIVGNTILMAGSSIAGVQLKGNSSEDPNLVSDQRNVVSGNTIKGDSTYGIYIQNHTNYNTISNNTIESPNTYGIYHVANEYNIFSNNTVISAGTDGIHSEGPAQISGNLVSLCGNNGIYNFANDSVISNNICFNNSQSSAGTYNGITIDARSRNVVSGNKCFDTQTIKTQGYGIAESGATTSNIFVGNQCQNNLTGTVLILSTTSNSLDHTGLFLQTGSALVQSSSSTTTQTSFPHLLQLSNTNTTVNNGVDIEFLGTDSAAVSREFAAIRAIFTDHTSSSIDADLAFWTSIASSRTEVARFSGGKMGIGVTAPSSKLDVAGDINTVQSSASTTPTSFPNNLLVQNSDTTTNNGVAIQFLGVDSAAASREFGAIRLIYTDHTSTSIDADLTFWTSIANVRTEAARFNLGNLGIGVTAPAHKIEIPAATTTAGGLGFGTDTNLYRSAADTLKTDDSLVIGASLTVGTLSGVLKASTGLVSGSATLTDLGSPTADFSMNSNKLTNLTDPSSAQDAATKSYVDAVATGMDVKSSVRVATTANITLSGAQTIDGVSAIAGDRVLVKDQSTGADNGIYVVAAGAWSRATDADSSTEVTTGLFTFVSEGTVNGDNGFTLTTNDPITLGSTALTFVQFSGAGQITAGAGLTKTGNTLDVGTASTARIVVNADSIDLATTAVTPSTYKSVTVDAYGRVTGGTNPTTLAGYGITDAQGLDATLTALAAYNTNGILTQTAADTFTGRTITGTAGTITVTNGDGVSGNPTLTISSSYVGQATITTLGTIVTGVWNGTAIDHAYLSGIAQADVSGLTTASSPTFAGLSLGTGNLSTVGNIAMGPDAARDITVGRNTTTSGSGLTIQSGGAASGGSNLSVGALILSTGIGTGSGVSNGIQFKHTVPGGSGTTDQTVSTMAIMWRQSGSQYNFVIGSTTTGHLGHGISIIGTAAAALGMIRHTTSNTAGNNLTVSSGGATSGATDKAGGDLILQSGTSTGTGASNIRFRTMTKALSTGTSDNSATDRAIYVSPKSITNSSATTIISLTNANGGVVAGVIRYCVEVTDGTDFQVEEGVITYHVTNKAGTIANNTVVKSGNQQAMTSGTLTVTFTITAANPALIQVNASSSLTPSTGYPRITFVVENFTQQAVTIS